MEQFWNNGTKVLQFQKKINFGQIGPNYAVKLKITVTATHVTW